MSGSESTHLRRRSRADAAPALIAVAVDGYPESRDAAALAATIAAVTHGGGDARCRSSRCAGGPPA